MAEWEKPASVCIDGMSEAEFERRSAAKGGVTVEQWRRQVIDALKAAKPGESTGMPKKRTRNPQALDVPARDKKNRILTARELNDVGARWEQESGSEGLEKLMAGKLGNAQFGPDKSGVDNYNGHRWPMWRYLETKGVSVYDNAWQPELFTSYVAADGSIVYPHGDTRPYVASRPGFNPKKGSFVKVSMAETKKDPKGFYRPIYARALENGHGADEAAELSTAGFAGMGATDVDPSKGTILQRDANKDVVYNEKTGRPQRFQPTLNFQTLGNQKEKWLDSSAEGDLDFKETQQAGWMIEHGKAGVIRNHEDVRNALGKLSAADRAKLDREIATLPPPADAAEAEAPAEPKPPKAKVVPEEDEPPPKAKLVKEQAKAQPKAKAKAKPKAGKKLVIGFPTVAIGSGLHCAGYANPACVHEGGGHVKEGSSGVYLGLFPFARVGDRTSDGLAVVTGADAMNGSVFVGGVPTSAKLEA